MSASCLCGPKHALTCVLYYSRNARNIRKSLQNRTTVAAWPFVSGSMVFRWSRGWTAVGGVCGDAGVFVLCVCVCLCVLRVSWVYDVDVCRQTVFYKTPFRRRSSVVGAHSAEDTHKSWCGRHIFRAHGSDVCVCVAPLLFQTCRGLCDCARCAGCMDMCVGVWRLRGGSFVIFVSQTHHTNLETTELRSSLSHSLYCGGGSASVIMDLLYTSLCHRHTRKRATIARVCGLMRRRRLCGGSLMANASSQPATAECRGRVYRVESCLTRNNSTTTLPPNARARVTRRYDANGATSRAATVVMVMVMRVRVNMFTYSPNGNRVWTWTIP